VPERTVVCRTGCPGSGGVTIPEGVQKTCGYGTSGQLDAMCPPRLSITLLLSGTGRRRR